MATETPSPTSLEEGRATELLDYTEGSINLFFDNSVSPTEPSQVGTTASGPEGPRTMLKRVSSRIINSQAPALQRQPSLLRTKSDSDSTTNTSSDQHVRFSRSALEVEESLAKKGSNRWLKFSKYVIGTMPAWERQLNEMESFWGAVLRFWDSFFRGIGQVGYINNSLAGVCVLIIALITDTWVGILGLIGCFCSTLFASFAKLNAERFRSGLFGYNGYLLGANMAVTILTAWDWKSILVTVVLSPLVIIFQVGCSNIFVNFDSPPFGIPLLTVIYMMYLCMYPSSFLRPWQRTPSLPDTRIVEYQVTADLVFEGMGASIAETFFTSNPWSAIAFLGLLLLRSPRYLIAAVTGAVFGNLTLFLLGVNAENIRNGLWGWNGVLTALALYGEFLEHDWRSWLYTSYAVIGTTVVQVGMIALFQVWGIPMSNISYTLVCIMFMTARKSIPGLQEKTGEQVPVDPAQLRKEEFAKRRAVSRFMKV